MRKLKMQKRGTNGENTIAFNNVYDMSNIGRLKHTEVSFMAHLNQVNTSNHGPQIDYLLITVELKPGKPGHWLQSLRLLNKKNWNWNTRKACVTIIACEL